MGLRFRKKIKLGTFAAINISKSTFQGKGASITLGGRGLGVNINKNGVEGFAGINGTGLGYRTKRHAFGKVKMSQDGLPKLKFNKTYNTKKSKVWAFISSAFCVWFAVYFFMVMLSLVGFGFDLFEPNEFMVVKLPIIVGLICGFVMAKTVNDDIDTCDSCGETKFYLNQDEYLGETYLYTNKCGAPDARRKHNPIISKSVVSCRCKACDHVLSVDEMLHD
ncbi:DUF4236 domain-containing protein [Vibrio europaeus]|uniref:DUF4236 domain-containing protein n=1 Tax=Vibrio europaeus TaxID=300876 RepID=UPI00148BAFB5|nr:DUF4236 domain-containing protein [Vibrio europaeus]NOH23860.1 DUF4236 domain-containing protein [Vibrio europaeus]